MGQGVGVGQIAGVAGAVRAAEAGLGAGSNGACDARLGVPPAVNATTAATTATTVPAPITHRCRIVRSTFSGASIVAFRVGWRGHRVIGRSRSLTLEYGQWREGVRS